MSSRMKASFHSVNASASRPTANRNVKSAEVEDRMVLLVTLVMDSEELKVNWARYQRGATCRGRRSRSGGRRSGS